jgi:peptidoglycan hydrolase CwlO-like protein
MAARQKLSEIEKCNLEWEKRKMAIRDEMSRTVSKREGEQKRIDQIHEQIEKLNELLQQSSDNIKKLQEEQ